MVPLTLVLLKPKPPRFTRAQLLKGTAWFRVLAMIINFLLIRCVLFFKASCIFIGSGRWKSDKPPTLYIFINCSTRDLAYIEKYVVRSVGIRKSKSSYFSLPYLQEISSKNQAHQCINVWSSLLTSVTRSLGESLSNVCVISQDCC